MKTKPKSYLSRTTVTILDNKWTIYFRDANQYKKLGVKGSKAFAFVQGPRREIHFDCSQVHPGDGVVIHELVHAYSRELMGHDLTLTPDEREEFFCTLFETRGKALLEKAAPLTKMLMKHAKKLQKHSQEDEDNE